MKIGWVGLGKLGAPVSATIAKFHDVKTYDIVGSPNTLAETCTDVDLIFIAVQTPHSPAYEGITDMPRETAPFDLSYLQMAVAQINVLAPPTVPIVIVSTVLPGDIRQFIYPFIASRPVLYNPAFIAMGTVEEDFLNPEFVLIGCDDKHMEAADLLSRVYLPMTDAPAVIIGLESAELAKVAYNCYISQKIVFANTLADICYGLGRGDVDEVTHALSLSWKRLHSPRYTSAGMGDSGPCHPRDNIAMAHLAEQLGLAADPFTFVTRAREAQSRFLADVVHGATIEHEITNVVLLGRPYKLGVDIEIGSSGLLLEHHLKKIGIQPSWDDVSRLGVFVLCLPTPRDDYLPGSVIIDPWGVQLDVYGCHVHRVGRN